MNSPGRRMFTREETVEMLTEALGIVSEVDPPSELLQQVFHAALTAVSSKEIPAIARGIIPEQRPLQ